jgi:hypothetical protein
MKAFAFALIGALLLSPFCRGENVAENLKPGLPEAELVKNSESPDHQWAIFEVHAYDIGMPTTAIAVVVADVKRTRMLGYIDACNRIAADFPDHRYLDIKWAPGSTYLALHDSTARNSVLHLYHVTETGLTPLHLPDLKQAALKQLDLTGQKVSSSGQIPIRWTSPDTLLIQVRVKTGDVARETDFTLQIAPDGSVRLTPAT